MTIEYEYPITGKVQGDGNQTVDNTVVSGLTNATTHQVSIVPEAATIGTVAVMVKPYGATAFRALKDEYGAAVVLDVAAPVDYIFDGNFDGLRFDPSGIDDTYGIAVSGW